MKPEICCYSRTERGGKHIPRSLTHVLCEIPFSAISFSKSSGLLLLAFSMLNRFTTHMTESKSIRSCKLDVSISGFYITGMEALGIVDTSAVVSEYIPVLSIGRSN